MGRRAWPLLSVLLCACAAGGSDPEETAGSEGGGGNGTSTGTGGSTIGVGGGGPVCDRWSLRAYEPGPDGVLGNADDVLGEARSVQLVDAANQITRETQYTSAGPDGQWETPDDVIVSDLRTSPVDGDAVWSISYDGPGPDGTWGNSDDHATAAFWAKRDASGKPIEERTSNGAGPDGVFATADDPVERRHTYSYADGQTLPKLVDLEFLGPGPDGAWGTADDPVAGATRRFDTWGTFAMDPGPNGVWADDDDMLSGRYEDRRDYKGYLQWLPAYGTGPDGAWFTPDDVITALAVSSCAGDSIDVRLIVAAGPDGAWETADDLVGTHLRVDGCPDICNAETPQSPTEPK